LVILEVKENTDKLLILGKGNINYYDAPHEKVINLNLIFDEKNCICIQNLLYRVISLQHFMSTFFQEPFLVIDDVVGTFELSSCYNVTIDCRAGDMIATVR